MFVDVVVELPVEGTFTYRVPDTLSDPRSKGASFGKRVLVPFGRRMVTGHVIGIYPTSSPPPTPTGIKNLKDIKDIIDVLDPEPIFDGLRFRFLKWLSTYYFAPLGAVLSMCSPTGSSVKSFRHFTTTPAGSSAPGETTGLALEILKKAEKGVSLAALLKAFARQPVYSTVSRLTSVGLLAEEIKLAKARGHRVEKYLAPNKSSGEKGTNRLGPLQKKVYEFLLERDGASLTETREALGGVDDAVRRLSSRGLIQVTEKRVLRDPLSGIIPKASDHEPNAEQAKAIDDITGAFRHGGFSPFLLYGVTGSGKTLVYLKVLEEVVAAGKKAVFMVPEIALTPWPAAYLVEKFPGRVALAHSGLTPGERYDEWMRVASGEADIVVGARSALFTPIKDLGLIIVDEEHETSYKQEEGVRYNGRDAAVMLAKFLKIPIILGSATPAIETFHNAKAGKLRLLTLNKRVRDGSLPSTELMDMRGLKRGTSGRGDKGGKGGKGGDGGKGTVISERLAEALAATLKDGHQALLFLNRRGFSSALICRDCGHTFSCLNCSVTLTLHKRRQELLCHYCDFSLKTPDVCPECEGLDLVEPGPGTEKVEEEVRRAFPRAIVVRMDRDTTRKKGAARGIIDAVERREADVLVGTQMVSKGHHFPGITLVGIISGDTSLSFPDFRSAERTLQLLTQAAGRAGRGEEPGTVIIQTLNPAHYSFNAAAAHDYEGFYNEEIVHRHEVMYPPFTRLCSFRVDAVSDTRAADAAGVLKSISEELVRRRGNVVTVLGPAPSVISRLKGRFRWQLLLKGTDPKSLHSFAAALKKSFEARSLPGVVLTVDMDPLNIV
jgi:primosomal protein N' (replication factor Y)